MVGTGAGNGLDASNAFIRDRGGVAAQDKTGSSRGEFWETGDGKILVVDGGIIQQDFSGLI